LDKITIVMNSLIIVSIFYEGSMFSNASPEKIVQYTAYYETVDNALIGYWGVT